ncbi:MAG TPA: hypothetical protein HPP77_11485 [Candidatus Hydrogenedentes bacterium]|nr:hypothetical protein [Candidatus Hydrogenedentota bacterium]HIJ74551.1 hypothetical protein [Candidatus Hydrogenedentota bacterium]
MTHLKRITVVKGEDDITEVLPVLDRVFGFVLELVDVKGKDADATT